MNYDLVLNPLQIGNGMITRSEIMDMIISAGKNNQLDPLETLRFYREVEKAAGEAVKAIDPAYDKSIDKAAADFAETLPEVMARKSLSTRTAVISSRRTEKPLTCRIQTSMKASTLRIGASRTRSSSVLTNRSRS